MLSLATNHPGLEKLNFFSQEKKPDQTSLYGYVKKRDFSNAQARLDSLSPQEIEEAFHVFQKQHSIHLIFASEPSDSALSYLDVLIAKCLQHNAGDHFFKYELFESSLRGDRKFVHHLIQHHHHFLEDQRIVRLIEMFLDRWREEDHLICESLIRHLSVKKPSTLLTDPLLKAVKKSRETAFRILLRHIDVAHFRYQGETLLHILVKSNANSLIDILWAVKRDEVVQVLDESCGPQKRTALHEAASRANGAAVSKLVSYGADYSKSDKDGKTPLQLVPPIPGYARKAWMLLNNAEFGFFKLDSKALKKAGDAFGLNASEATVRKERGLYKCCEMWELKRAQQLLDGGVRGDRVDPVSGDTPLFVLIKKSGGLIKREQKILEFVKKYGNNLKLDHAKQKQENLLTLALNYALLNLAAYLIENHDDTIDVNFINQDDLTSLELAAKSCYSVIVTKLLATGQLDLSINNQGLSALYIQNDMIKKSGMYVSRGKLYTDNPTQRFLNNKT